MVEDPEQPWLDLEPGSTLEQLAAAAVRYRIALGPIAGRKILTLHNPAAVSDARESAKPLTAARDGFSLNSARVCEDHQRDKLERLCRYVSRGPITHGSAGAAKHMDVRERPMRNIATTLSTVNPRQLINPFHLQL